MTPYFFKQMRKRTGLCLVVVLTALAFSLALCMLQRSRDQMAARIEEVYDNLEVRCSVTNLTGTQSDRLNLPEWVLRLFTTGMTTGNFQEDGLFTPYVRDVQVRSTVYCTQPGGTVPHALSGITGLAADSALQPDSGCTILWREGFDASVFQGRGYSLLLPEELAAWEDEDGYVTLEFSPSSGGWRASCAWTCTAPSRWTACPPPWRTTGASTNSGTSTAAGILWSPPVTERRCPGRGP